MLLRDELYRRQDSQSRRLGSVESAGGVLVAAAAVFGGLLQLSQGAAFVPASPARDFFETLALVLSFCGALLGVISLFPREISELEPLGLRQELLSKGRADAALGLVDGLIGHIKKREAVISRRFKLVRCGLLSLGGAVACAVAPRVYALIFGA